MIKKISTDIISYLIGVAKRNKTIQNIFESPFDLNKYPVFDEYQDRRGHIHRLRQGLRNKIRPGWESMFKPQNRAHYSKDTIASLINAGIIEVEKISSLAEINGFQFKGSTILEIGCNSGAACYALSAKGAKHVVGTEFNGYKLNATKEALDSTSLKDVDENMSILRHAISKHYPDVKNVEFMNDDICNTSLDSNQYDIILSWQVLEHLSDPVSAFQSIYRLLKPGGICIHEYNPFFCLNGGHSLCTLDFLWGHVLLNESDFEKYLDKFRPKEKEKAMSFYNSGLNRMSISDLKKAITSNNLKITGFIPYPKEQHTRMVNEDTLKIAKTNYDSLELLDLITPRIYVAARKLNDE